MLRLTFSISLWTSARRFCAEEEDLVFLETFATDEFQDVSLNQWLRRVPSEMLKAHLNIGKEMALKIPTEKLAVI